MRHYQSALPPFWPKVLIYLSCQRKWSVCENRNYRHDQPASRHSGTYVNGWRLSKRDTTYFWVIYMWPNNGKADQCPLFDFEAFLRTPRYLNCGFLTIWNTSRESVLEPSFQTGTNQVTCLKKIFPKTIKCFSSDRISKWALFGLAWWWQVEKDTTDIEHWNIGLKVDKTTLTSMLLM